MYAGCDKIFRIFKSILLEDKEQKRLREGYHSNGKEVAGGNISHPEEQMGI